MTWMTELLDQEERGLVQDLRLSYSRISSFDLEGPSTLVKRKELSGEGITMGGLIDLLLFEPDKFKSEYYVFRAKIPTATLKELSDVITTNYTEVPSREKVYDIAKQSNFWSSVVKEETYYKKFDNEDFWSYLKAVFESKNKTIVSVKDLEWAEQVVEVLKTHKDSKDIVAYPEENEDKYAQLELEFQYRQFAFKGLVDLVIVNHKDKTVRFIDLKTGAPKVEEFSKSFVKYRYYIQALLYVIGAGSFMEKYSLEGYTLLPFEFLYISRFQKIPLIYEVTPKWEDAALYGFTTTAGYKYKGLNELLDDIDWHWTNKEFDLPRDIVEAKGRVLINDNFIEINE